MKQIAIFTLCCSLSACAGHQASEELASTGSDLKPLQPSESPETTPETDHLTADDSLAAEQPSTDKANPSDSDLDEIKTGVGTEALLSSSQVETLLELDQFSRYQFDGSPNGPEDSEGWDGQPYGIILPTYIPPGFDVTDVSITTLQGPDGPGAYEVTYSNSLNQCFAIWSASGGLGADADEYQVVEVVSPALGEVKIGYTEFSQITSAPAAKMFVSQGEYMYWFDSPANSCNQTVSLNEAAKIVESLAHLNPNPEGYPPTKQLEPL